MTETFVFCPSHSVQKFAQGNVTRHRREFLASGLLLKRPESSTGTTRAPFLATLECYSLWPVQHVQSLRAIRQPWPQPSLRQVGGLGN